MESLVDSEPSLWRVPYTTSLACRKILQSQVTPRGIAANRTFVGEADKRKKKPYTTRRAWTLLRARRASVREVM